ncbi:MAG TPA: SPOR domain-containing protein [Treponemataceae bacterium]|jgi:cell division septation protein DedD|nr:SPOR domain-containing protein [Treponemataceae bacterium]
MEQNRVLWIVGAVGAFLLVVVGAALLLYSPSRNPDASMTSIQNLDSTWVSQQPLKLEPLNTQQSQNISSLPVADSSKPNPGTAPLNTNQQAGSDDIPNTVQSLNVYSGQTTVISGQTTAIDLNDITRVSGSGQQPVSPQAVAPVQTGVVKNTVTTSTQQLPKTTAASSSPAKTAPASSTPSKASTASVTSAKTSSAPKAISDKYWIQAASFTSKKNAEELRAELSAQKINSEIFTFTDANSVMYYRVRVGPYSTKSEAEYWQTRVTLVDSLSTAKTYITNSSAPKN